MESAKERFTLFVLDRLARLESSVEARFKQVEQQVAALEELFLTKQLEVEKHLHRLEEANAR